MSSNCYFFNCLNYITRNSALLGCFLVYPWLVFCQGQSTLGWLWIPFVGIQNTGLKKFLKWNLQPFLDLVFYCLCFLMSWASFHKHDTSNWIYVTKHVGNSFSINIFHTSDSRLASMWFWAQIVIYISVDCVMFVEWSSRHR